jgi:hypothetical protein
MRSPAEAVTSPSGVTKVILPTAATTTRQPVRNNNNKTNIITENPQSQRYSPLVTKNNSS